MLLLAATFLAGHWIGDFNAVANDYRAASKKVIDLQRAKSLAPSDLDAAREQAAAAAAAFETPHARIVFHRLLGVAAALMAILVNSIAITYFIGTSRWCKEVSETYDLPAELVRQSTQLKRRTFPWALAGILMVILLVGLGAAADPSGANRANSSALVTPHYVAALIGLIIIGVAFFVQFTRIAENHTVIERVLAEVQRIRVERGLKPLEQIAP